MSRAGMHAHPVNEHGGYLPDRSFGWDMAVYGDFPTKVLRDGEFADPEPWPADNGLAQAEEWAHKVLAADDRAVAVWIRESIQDIPGVSSWHAGRHVKTIER